MQKALPLLLSLLAVLLLLLALALAVPAAARPAVVPAVLLELVLVVALAVALLLVSVSAWLERLLFLLWFSWDLAARYHLWRNSCVSKSENDSATVVVADSPVFRKVLFKDRRKLARTVVHCSFRLSYLWRGKGQTSLFFNCCQAAKWRAFRASKAETVFCVEFFVSNGRYLCVIKNGWSLWKRFLSVGVHDKHWRNLWFFNYQLGNG